MLGVAGTLAIGYLFIFALVIGWICYRQTEKTLEFLSFFFFNIIFGWTVMLVAYLIGNIINHSVRLF